MCIMYERAAATMGVLHHLQVIFLLHARAASPKVSAVHGVVCSKHLLTGHYRREMALAMT